MKLSSRPAVKERRPGLDTRLPISAFHIWQPTWSPVPGVQQVRPPIAAGFKMFRSHPPSNNVGDGFFLRRQRKARMAVQYVPNGNGDDYIHDYERYQKSGRSAACTPVLVKWHCMRNRLAWALVP